MSMHERIDGADRRERGLQYRCNPVERLSLLVLMAVVTTFMISPILSRLIRGTGMEPYFLVFDFVKRGRPGLK